MKKDKKAEEFKELVHRLWDECDDEMDRLELKGYIDNENQPRMAALNGDDKIGVDEVLVIGAYMVLTKLHNAMHHEDMDEKISAMLRGDIELRDIAPKDMPTEVVDILEKIVDVTRKAKKKSEEK